MATPSSDNLKEIQDIYINIPYKWGDNIKREKEVIDIISDYPWIADEIISSDTKILLDNENSSIEYKKRTNIPFCYVIERKSAANAGIANIWNMLHHMVTTGEKGWDLVSGFFKELSNKINTDKNNTEANKNKEAPKTEDSADQKSSKTAQNKEDAKKESTPESSWSSTISSSISTIKKTLSELTAGGSLMDKVSPLMKDNNLRNDILMPYKYMYITKPTGKNYVFPLTNGSSSFSTVKNTWGSGSLLPGSIQSLIDGVFAATDFVSSGLNLISNVKNFFNGKGDDTNYDREIAKGYQYPTDGDSVEVSFYLYNTTKLNAWKSNYKFLFLFYLRNLPLRIDVTSYIPPLLYDIIIPGVKRLPVACVDSITVKAYGMTRTLTCPNFINGEGDLMVNVPEAWEVNITFKSLINSSANLMLAGIFGALNVSSEKKEGEAPSPSEATTNEPKTEPANNSESKTA